MKKALYILSIVLLFVSCKPEDVISGAAISFYPTTVNTAVEEDDLTYILSLEASGFVGSGTATVEVDLSAEGTLFTNPPLSGNTLTVEITDGTTTQIEVTVLNDLTPDDYTAVFRIVDVTGDLGGIGTDEFTLFVLDNDNVPIFREDFNAGFGTFTGFSEEGAQEWGTTDFGFEDAGVRMSGFSGGPQDNKDWLVSEAIDLSGLTSAKVQFVTDVAFEVEPALEFRVSTDYDGGGDPTTATWTTLDATYDILTGFDTWTPSGNIDVSAYTSSATYFAFYYVSTTDGSAQWTLDNFQVSVFNPDASGGGNDNLASLPFTEDFENCTVDFEIPSAFEVQYASGSKDDRGWACRQFGVDGSRAVRVNTFGGDAGTSDTWLISQNKFDLSAVPFGTLEFDVKSAGSGDGTLRAYYSTNYFGVLSLATWEELDISGQLPAKGSDTYTTVSTSVGGGSNVYIAFQFEGSSETSSASYDIDNINFVAGNGGGGTFTLPFTDDFESCATVGDFNIPSDWIEALVAGTKTDRGWGCRAFGRNGSNAPRASSFGGEDGEDDAWLITNGTIDLTGVTSASLVFWVESRFSGPGDLQVLWSTDYAGVGDPSTATWTQLTDVAGQLPAEGSEVFTEITSDMSGAAGSEVYLAFRYFGGTASASVALTIDDVSLTGS